MLKESIISIIVPVYNAEKHIKKFINMLNKQTYKEFEVIFINDGSTDSSYSILKQYIGKDNRFKLLDKNNGGPSSARNMGIKEATSEYLTFFDIDDTITDNAIQIFVEGIEKYNFDIIRFNYYLSTFENKKYKSGKKYDLIYLKGNNNDVKNEVISSIVEGKLSTFIWVLVIKKSFLMSNYLFFDEELKYMEDKVFYLDIFSNCQNFVFLNDLIYFYYYDVDFLNKGSDFYIYYLQNIKIVFIKIFDRVKGDSKLEIATLINVFRQLNCYLYVLYDKHETDIEFVIEKYSLFEFCKPIPKRKDLTLFEKICRIMINYSFYFGLKTVYYFKKKVFLLKKRGV